MLRTAVEHYRQSALTARRAAREARRVKPRGILAVGSVVAKYQVTQAAQGTRAVALMLDEQDLDAAAEALLNSAAFTTSVQMLEAMVNEAGDDGFDRLVESLVQDAGRAAEEVAVAVRPEIGHVRYLNLPSCARCAVLAGRVYRYSSGFLRHPGCDCVMIPTALANTEFIQDPVDLARRGLVHGLSKADRRAILEGDADFNQVVNVRSRAAGLQEAGRVLARNGKMTPEGIFRAAGDDRDQVAQLLEANGYTRPAAARQAGQRSAGGGGAGKPPPPPSPPASAPEPGEPEYLPFWKARQEALEGPRFTADGETLEPDEVRFVERLLRDADQEIRWIPRDTDTWKPTNDFVWRSLDGEQYELKSTAASYARIKDHIVDDVARTLGEESPKVRFVADIGIRVLTDRLRKQLAKYNVRQMSSPDPKLILALWVMHSDGELEQIELETVRLEE